MTGDPVAQAMDIQQSVQELLELVKDQSEVITEKQGKELMHILREISGYIRGIQLQVMVQ